MNEKLLFCGNSTTCLSEDLVKESNKSNGGPAFRIPSLINSNGTLIAAVDRASSGADWGYIGLAVRRSEDGGETWTDLETVATPPAREVKITPECQTSAFFIDPCMAVAPNGDVIMIADLWPECKGLHNKRLLEKKPAYGNVDGETCLLLYDKGGNFYYVKKDGAVLDSKKAPTPYTIKNGIGELYKGEEYVGNVFLDGPMGKNEMGVKLTFGAPLKVVKRSYIYMLRSGDNGKTWSNPVDITGSVLRKEDGVFLGVAPGVGLTTSTGRIIMPLYVANKECVAIYSDDCGATWHRNPVNPYAKNIDEWQLVEAKDGTLIGLGRQKGFKKTPLSFSTNNGSVWQKGGKTGVKAPKCQKSVITAEGYVFCSHASQKKRANGVLSVGKIVPNGGAFCKIEWFNHVEINTGFFAYSCLAQIDNNTIGCFYESQPSSYLQFKTFKISEITK